MILFGIIALTVMLFGFVILFGAPYLPTLKRQQETALDLLDLEPGQTLVELGSGDGRMLRAAAKRGVNAIGFELNPVLVLVSRVVTWRYRHLISVKTRNYWKEMLPPCEGVYVFLLDRYMKKLDKKITQEKHNSLRLVSYAFKIPGKKPVTEKKGMYLYDYSDSSN